MFHGNCSGEGHVYTSFTLLSTTFNGTCGLFVITVVGDQTICAWPEAVCCYKYDQSQRCMGEEEEEEEEVGEEGEKEGGGGRGRGGERQRGVGNGGG